MTALYYPAKHLQRAVLLARPSRFTSLVDLQGVRRHVFVPNPGRLQGLLVPGATVYLQVPEKAQSRRRKTLYDLLFVRHRRRLVCIDTRVANDLVAHWLTCGLLPEFAAYRQHRREVVFGKSRFDFLLEGPAGSCFVEVKSCTLARRGRVEFPDAPTDRGVRHLGELAEAVQAGMRACVVFCLYREDGIAFSPADDIDAKFGATLRAVLRQGVEAFAYQVRTRRFGMSFAGSRPVLLP